MDNIFCCVVCSSGSSAVSSLAEPRVKGEAGLVGGGDSITHFMPYLPPLPSRRRERGSVISFAESHWEAEFGRTELCQLAHKAETASVLCLA